MNRMGRTTLVMEIGLQHREMKSFSKGIELYSVKFWESIILSVPL